MIAQARRSIEVGLQRQLGAKTGPTINFVIASHSLFTLFGHVRSRPIHLSASSTGCSEEALDFDDKLTNSNGPAVNLASDAAHGPMRL